VYYTEVLGMETVKHSRSGVSYLMTFIAALVMGVVVFFVVSAMCNSVLPSQDRACGHAFSAVFAGVFALVKWHGLEQAEDYVSRSARSSR
jgi:hypothetical protein